MALFVVPALALLAGCGPDLAKLETEEQALAKEVAVLRTNVEEMRTQMQAMGLVPAGPAVAPGASAEIDLSSQIPVKVSRAGDPPTFPELGAPERRESTDCGYRFASAWLEPISDQTLEQSGSGRASPLLVLQDDRALSPHAAPGAFEKACRFSFKHGPKYVFLTPDASVDAIGGTWRFGLSPDLPMLRGGDDRPLYWVYPGTTLTFELGAGWDAEAWGTMEVTLEGRVFYVGTPEAPAPHPGSPVTASFLGYEQSGKEPLFGLAHTPEPPDGPWTLELTSPSDGPYLLLNTLVIGNDQHALVITAEGEGAE